VTAFTVRPLVAPNCHLIRVRHDSPSNILRWAAWARSSVAARPYRPNI
jgi:hypothetical protein